MILKTILFRYVCEIQIFSIDKLKSKRLNKVEKITVAFVAK